MKMSDRAGPVVLIELNEVPNEVLDAYARTRSSFLADLLASSDRYVTVTPDRVQLDPWIAWPTFHRGVNDEAHRLLRLGQDTTHADAAYPPIWRILRDRGLSVGVYGSLFSSCEEDHAGYAFFVPDVFSPHHRVEPRDLQRFQSFNLDMTRASARNADDGVSSGGARAMLDLVKGRRLTAGTLARVAAQVVTEKFQPRKVSRRRNVQTELHADIFASLLKQHRLDFATFYTNNVAAAMHRFWSASVPGAALNRGRLSDEWIETYADEVFEALYSVERLLVRLRSGELGPMTIVVASALGQEEIPAENYSRFLTITDLDAFARALLGEEAGSARFVAAPTMVPDFSLRFEDEAHAATLARRFGNMDVGGHRPVETLERMHVKELVGDDARMSHIRHHYGDSTDFKHPVTFKQSDARTVHLSFQIDDYDGPAEARVGNELIPFDAMGIGWVGHDEGVNCTAQHCAEGSMTVWRPNGGPRHAGLRRVSSLDFAPSLLSRLGVPAPAYMGGEVTIAL